MILSTHSFTLVLDLIEDRINQLDPLLPQNAHDLDVLIRCREEMKVTAIAAGRVNEEAGAYFQGHREARRQPPAPMDVSLDVI